MALDRAVLYFIISIHSDDTAGFNRLPNHSFCPGPVNRDGLCNVPVFSIPLPRIQIFYPPPSHNTAWLFCVLVGDQGTWHVPEKTADVYKFGPLFALVATGLLIMLTIPALSDFQGLMNSPFQMIQQKKNLKRRCKTRFINKESFVKILRRKQF